MNIDPISTVSITFNNLTDDEAKTITRWREYQLVLWNLDEELRQQIKYNNNISDAERQGYEYARDSLGSLMEEYGVSLDDFS